MTGVQTCALPILKKVLGTSIGGHWANSIMPTVFTYQAEHRNEAQKTDEKGLKPVARGKTGALNIKKKLDSVIHITMNSSVLAFNQETRTSLPKVEEVEKNFIQAIELMGMFFTNIQSGGRVHDYALIYDSSRNILTTRADAACFNILNFAVNSLFWEEYFDQLHKSLAGTMFKILSTQRQYEYMMIELDRQGGYRGVRERIQGDIKRFSLKSSYRSWARKYGACALPVQHFDMMYNIIKRQQNDQPHGLKVEAEPSDFLDCCRVVYQNLLEALEEQDEFYNQCLSPKRIKFAETFQNCPFISLVLKKDLLPAVRLLEDWMTQVVKNMTIVISDDKRGLLEIL